MAIAGFIAAGLATVTSWGARYGSHNAEQEQLRRDVDAQKGDKAELRAIGETLGRIDERMKSVERRLDGMEQGMHEIRVDLRELDKKR